MDMQVLGACVSTKGSNAENVVNASGEEHDANIIPTMGLYVQGDNCTRLVALGNIYDGGSTIHGVAYADDVVRVNVKKIYVSDAEVLFPTLEIKYVKEALDTFIAWPTNLVKVVSHEDSHVTPKKWLNMFKARMMLVQRFHCIS
ncbi:hypothetical protein GmHk_01G001267 [Glycine max]|nr:hypothetical protein GmHk_01G001267 [Glycine max]